MKDTLKSQIEENRKNNENKEKFDDRAYKKEFLEKKKEEVNELNKDIRKFRRIMIDWLRQNHKKDDILEKINKQVIDGLSNDKEVKLDLSRFDIIAKVTGSYDGFHGPYMTPFDHLDMKPVHLSGSYLDVVSDYRKHFDLMNDKCSDSFSFEFDRDDKNEKFDLHKGERLYMEYYNSAYDAGETVRLLMRYDIFKITFNDGFYSGYDSSSSTDRIEIKLSIDKIIKYLDKQGVKVIEKDDKKKVLTLTLK